MTTIRNKIKSDLESIGASLDPSCVSRFYCCHTTDQIPYSVYDWKGNLLYTEMRKRDIYIWVGAHGAVYVTGVPWIHSKRPKSTIQTPIVTEMIESVYKSLQEEAGQ